MTDGWGVFSAWATAIGALATGASAVIIAIQTKRTRDALELARKEQIDVDMPRLTVTTDPNYRAFRVTVGAAGPEYVQVDNFDQQQFQMPRGGDFLLAVDFVVTIRNEGPRSASISLETYQTPTFPAQHHQIPANSEPVTTGVRISQSVEKWVTWANDTETAWDRRTFPESHPLFSVHYEYPGDFGADEDHRFSISGSVLKRVAGVAETWQMVEPADIYGRSLEVRELPFTRTYYRSRTKNARMK